MYSISIITDMRGSSKTLLETQNFEEINEIIKNKQGFHYIEKDKNSYMSVQSFGEGKYEVLEFGLV